MVYKYLSDGYLTHLIKDCEQGIHSWFFGTWEEEKNVFCVISVSSPQ